MIKIFSKILLVCILTFFFLLFAFFVWLNHITSHKSDKKLISNFHANKAKLELIIDMAKEDAPATVIAPSWISPANVISRARWDEYKILFAELELSGGVRIRRKGTFEFISTAWGVPSAGSGKGYFFSEEELTPQYPSLDKNPPTLGGYRKIDENWYIFLHNHD